MTKAEKSPFEHTFFFQTAFIKNSLVIIISFCYYFL